MSRLQLLNGGVAARHCSLISLAAFRPQPPAVKGARTSAAMAAAPEGVGSVFDLARAWPLTGSGADAAAAAEVLQVTSEVARCTVPGSIAQRFGMREDNEQLVVSVTNRITAEQAWFNVARAQKPQTFGAGSAAAERSMLEEVATQDSTGAGATCDFCRWRDNTAVDTFGRMESENVVSASNLFKYVAPGHGLLLFKHHDPLTFTAGHIQELLEIGAKWFTAAAAAAGGSERRWPMLLWNCMPRAGASQFHGHAQTALSEVPFPADLLAMRAAEQYEAAHDGRCYHAAVRSAHAAAGLLLQHGPPEDRAWVYASLTPRKDAEIVIHGTSLTSPCFAVALHAALRTLIDDLLAPCFNAAVQPMWDSQARASTAAQPFADCKVIARVVSRGKLSSRASDFGGLEIFGNANIGHTDPYAVHLALSRQLAAASQHRTEQ